MKSHTAVDALAALAQESRLSIYRLLVQRGPDGYTPSELSEGLAIPAPTLSFHLRVLNGANLITARREGRFLYYSANFDHMRQIVDFLTENCCRLSDSECGPDCTPKPRAKRERA